MSPTATASDIRPPRARRTRFAPRWLVLTHRYLGVVLGALMLVWCLSGFVMLFVHWPEVDRDQRAAGLAPLDWGACCRLDGAAPDDLRLEGAAVEMLGARPVLRLAPADGARQVIDLATGRALVPLGQAEARDAATPYAQGSPIVRAELVQRDQWTVAAPRDGARPLWRLRLADGADLYLSSRTGELVQRTTPSARVLNWFGAIPHWLYPAILRQDVKLWTQVVIWTSLAGALLTVGGLWLGLVAWRPFADRRLTPFRGLMAWHHLGSLFAGVLTLTWVASGLFSMNPWGFLESPPDPAAERLAGPPPAWSQVRPALAAAIAARPAAHRLTLAPFDDAVFVMADGRRLDADGRPAPLDAAALGRAGVRLGDVRAEGLIDRGDAYYFAHHEPVRLPAWRAVTADGHRYYLDPASGALLADIDGAARGYRWLHQGLHRLDVVPGLDRGPVWAALSAVLLAAVTLGVAAGVWLAWRRLLHDLAGLRRALRKSA